MAGTSWKSTGTTWSEILSAFERAASTAGRPSLIIAHTVKGKGVSFMENQAGWHGIAPDREKFEKAMVDLATPAVPAERQAAMLARAQAYAQSAAATSDRPSSRTSGAITGGMRARR